MSLLVVLATGNPGKVAELTALFEGRLDLMPRPVDVPDVAETAVTLEGNARLKAEALSRATGLPALADDTGLEVVALDGGPGVRSARFAGERATDDENIDLLLARLEGVTDRRARFRTVAYLHHPEKGVIWAEGTVSGEIAPKRRGTEGFGYDPVFIPEGDRRTFGEMNRQDKQRISHRGRAFRLLEARLETESWVHTASSLPSDGFPDDA